MTETRMTCCWCHAEVGGPYDGAALLYCDAECFVAAAEARHEPSAASRAANTEERGYNNGSMKQVSAHLAAHDPAVVHLRRTA